MGATRARQNAGCEPETFRRRCQVLSRKRASTGMRPNLAAVSLGEGALVGAARYVAPRQIKLTSWWNAHRRQRLPRWQ
eukprot:3009580-Pyramimonas_sp.AAC.1